MQFGKISEKTKRAGELIRKITELGQEQKADINDVRNLIKLIETNYSDIQDDVFVSSVATVLREIDKDGRVDSSEKDLLLSFEKTLEEPISSEPVTEVLGKNFVLTGDFDIQGGKQTVEEMISAAGGVVKSGTSKKVQYVVRGNKGSEAWSFGNFGTKIEKALTLNLTGKAKIKIVSEEALLAYFKLNSQDAMDVLRNQEARFSAQWNTAKVVSNNFTGLTNGQQKVFDLVKDGHNVYLTGLGGTGKSYVLNKIIEWAGKAGKNVIVCAPTGIAALNIGGSTIHRALDINPNKTLQMNPYPTIKDGSPIPECDLMIVDEISMCRMDLFDYLSSVLFKAARIREKEGKPRCQLVVVGDFCQLPPVVQKSERPILEQKYGFDVGGAYAFMGKYWNKWTFKSVELTEAIRQRDSDFVAALNACRVGDTRGVHWITEYSSKHPIDNAIVLCGRNSKAESENNKRLGMLDALSTTYIGEKTGEVEEKDMPTAERLTLKPGARVMSLINDREDTYMNGTLGTVIKCKKDGVAVMFDGGRTELVPLHTWNVTKPTIVDGKTKSETIGTYTQVPLKLAWAITIHKSQGQTFDSATLFPECWDYGQLYTALSRLTKVENLFIAEPVNDSYLKTSPDVIKFLEGRYEGHFCG
jgi:ATP-dependent DNA helicase PIF1